MRFVDRLKGMTGQAQEAAKSAGTSVPGIGGAAAQARKVNRIAEVGVETTAVLRSMTDTGVEDAVLGTTEYTLEVEVRPEGGTPYNAKFNQQLVPVARDTYQAKLGDEVVVRVDPETPSSMFLAT